MNYRFKPGMGDFNFDYSTWDKTDLVIGGLIAFALLMGFSAMQSAGSRLRSPRSVWK